MVGNDFFGRLYVTDLKKHGVQTRIFYDPETPTGVCTCLVSQDGERTFLVHRGATDNLGLEKVEKVTNLIAKTKILYVSGYSLANQPLRDAIRFAVKFASKNNTKVMFDLASHNLILAKRDVFWEIVKYSNYICLNLQEAQSLIGKENSAEIINDLTQYVDLVALKMGSDGCIMATRQTRIHVSTEKVKCVDSTGAGDWFASAVVFGLVNGLSAKSIGTLGNLLGSNKVQHIGPRYSPSREEIQFMLSKVLASNGSKNWSS
jgi:sugar/nucleoside kinase (ribokinase family)